MSVCEMYILCVCMCICLFVCICVVTASVPCPALKPMPDLTIIGLEVRDCLTLSGVWINGNQTIFFRRDRRK